MCTCMFVYNIHDLVLVVFCVCVFKQRAASLQKMACLNIVSIFIVASHIRLTVPCSCQYL